MNTMNGILITKVRLQKRRNAHGEYEVKFEDMYGKLIHEATYFTDSFDDADDSARHSASHFGCPYYLNGELELDGRK